MVKRKRAAAKLTQGQLACALYPNLAEEEAEKRKGDISKLENGRTHNPTTQTIQRIADAVGISGGEIDALHRRVQMSASEQLDHIPVLDRDALELLASRFDIPQPHAMTDAALQQELTKRAEDYRRYKAEVDGIDERYRSLSNLKAAAQDAINRIDLPEVDRLLELVHETELEEAARTAELRADNALLRGDPVRAAAILSSAADSFGAIDVAEPGKRKWQMAIKLQEHGIRYGGQGLILCNEMCMSALAVLNEKDNPRDVWATHTVRANALENQGTRTQGPEGTALLAEAVDSHRAALRVRTEADHPVDWAMTMQNLANALRTQGTRTQGPEGAALLAEAVDSYRAALRVFTEVDHSVYWGGTMQNLGNALANQGTRTQWPEGATLLGEAVGSFRAALRVRTEAEHPVQWAMTMQNLGNALKEQGTRTQGPEGAALLGEAVDSYRAALRVFTEAEHPVYWAMTMQNLAIALQKQGTRTSGPEGAALLGEAVDSYRAALRVRTEAEHPVDWAITQENMALAEMARAEHDTTADPRPHLEAALFHVENALRIYDPEHMSYDHGTATALRNRIQAALDALPSSSS